MLAFAIVKLLAGSTRPSQLCYRAYTIVRMTRRTFLPAFAAAGAAMAAPPDEQPIQRKGRLKQCVTGGVFGRGRSIEDNARDATRMGCKGYDLIGPKDWPILKKYG